MSKLGTFSAENIKESSNETESIYVNSENRSVTRNDAGQHQLSAYLNPPSLSRQQYHETYIQPLQQANHETQQQWQAALHNSHSEPYAQNAAPGSMLMDGVERQEVIFPCTPDSHYLKGHLSDNGLLFTRIESAGNAIPISSHTLKYGHFEPLNREQIISEWNQVPLNGLQHNTFPVNTPEVPCTVVPSSEMGVVCNEQETFELPKYPAGLTIAAINSPVKSVDHPQSNEMVNQGRRPPQNADDVQIKNEIVPITSKPMESDCLKSAEQLQKPYKDAVLECPVSSTPKPQQPTLGHTKFEKPKKSRLKITPLRSTIPEGRCYRCKKYFKDTNSYVEHVSNSDCEILDCAHKCSLCPLSFMVVQELEEHVRLHFFNRYFCNRYCGKYFTTIGECERHEYTQHTINVYKCNSCKDQFATRDGFFTHIQIHINSTRNVCAICRHEFDQECELQKHKVYCLRGFLGRKRKFPSIPMSNEQNGAGRETDDEDQSRPMNAEKEDDTVHTVNQVPSKRKRKKLTHGKAQQKQNESSTLQQNQISIFDENLCCVASCGTRGGPTNLFPFPQDKKYLLQWLHNLKFPLEPRADFSKHRICLMHFCGECKETYSGNKQRLRPWALPTCHLGHSDTLNMYQCKTIDQPIQCAILNCKSQFGQSGIYFFPFPKGKEMIQKWCRNARIPFSSPVERFICSLHFERRCFGADRLKAWALPTLNLSVRNAVHLNRPHQLVKVEKKCSLEFCGRKRDIELNISLHKFPRDNVLYRKWCYNFRLHPYGNYGNFLICSTHFTRNCYGKRNLLFGVVPTQNLGHQELNDIYLNNFITNKERLRLMSINVVNTKPIERNRVNNSDPLENPTEDKCLVRNCGQTRSTPNITFHTLPRSPDRRKKWAFNLKMNLQNYGRRARVCSAHFEEYCFGQRCLKKFAIPTLTLGHSDMRIYHNLDHGHRSRSNLRNLRYRRSTRISQHMNVEERNETRQHMKEYHKTEKEQNIMPVENCENVTPSLSLYEGDSEDSTLNFIKAECCVSTCGRNTNSDNVTFFSTPEDEDQLRKWSHNLQLPVNFLRTAKVCELHFENYCIQGHIMKEWAVPTLNLAHSMEYLYENPLNSEYDMNNTNDNKHLLEMKINLRCSLKHCGKTRYDGVRLFRFPSYNNRTTLMKWCHNVGMPMYGSTFRRVCSDHFEEANKNAPNLNLLPTLNLNHGPGYKIYHNTYTNNLLARDKHLPIGYPKSKCVTPRHCYLTHCRKTVQHGVHLYGFPLVKPDLFEAWKNNLGELPNQRPKNLRLCSDHFEKYYIRKGRLLPGAIPTLNINPIGAPKIVPLTTFYRESQFTRILLKDTVSVTCMVKNCLAIDSRMQQKCFNVPQTLESLLKWCFNLKIHFNEFTDRSMVCARHFESICFRGNNTLHRWAVPTLNLMLDKRGENHCNTQRLVRNPTPDEQQLRSIAKCLIPTCNKSCKLDNVTLYRFPTQMYVFRRWKAVLQLNYLCYQMSHRYKICGDHFKKSDLLKTQNRLKHRAVPSLCLDYLEYISPEPVSSSTTLHTAPLRPPSSSLLPLPMANDCLFRGCEDTVTYPLPRNKELKTIWSDIVKRENHTSDVNHSDDENDSENGVYLCGNHFRQTFEKCLDHLHSLESQNQSSSNQMDVENLMVNLEPSRLIYKRLDKTDSTVADVSFLKEARVRLKRLRLPLDKRGGNHISIDTNQSNNNPPPQGSQYRNSSYCCVPTCNNRSGSSHRLTMFSFPRDYEVLKKWCENLNLEPWQCVGRQRICSDHFELQALGCRRLKAGAVPTLNLPPSNRSKHPNQP